MTLAIIIYLIGCKSNSSTSSKEKAFSMVLNQTQYLISDTIYLVNEFSKNPQKIHETLSFRIMDSLNI